MNRGVVCVGYQGIGKSTLADKYLRYIDLESGNFWIKDRRSPDWYIPYVNIAVDLASQGYVVFISSHKDVRDYLNSLELPVGVNRMCCVPSEEIKYQWINKLYQRYQDSQLDKDYKAWKNAEDRYIENIREIKARFDIVCEIPSVKYDLLLLMQDTFRKNDIQIYLN